MHNGIPQISVIVPCLNQSEELDGCLTALADQKTEIFFEVIVVDSAHDPMVERVVFNYPKIKLVRDNGSLACGAAKALGAAHAKADYFAFTDADCIPYTNWVENIYRTLVSGGIMVGGPVLNTLPYHPVAIIDNLLQFIDFPLRRPEGAIRHIPGCNIGVRKSVYSEAGGFPDYQSGDDVILTTNVNKLYPGGIYFNSTVIVSHKGRRKISHYWKHQKSFGFIRANLGLHISKYQQRLGKLWIMVPAVILKRLVYLMQRILRWNSRAIPRNIILLPIILIGLTGWAIGFRNGCKQAFNISEENV